MCIALFISTALANIRRRAIALKKQRMKMKAEQEGGVVPEEVELGAEWDESPPSEEEEEDKKEEEVGGVEELVGVEELGGPEATGITELDSLPSPRRRPVVIEEITECEPETVPLLVPELTSRDNDMLLHLREEEEEEEEEEEVSSQPSDEPLLTEVSSSRVGRPLVREVTGEDYTSQEPVELVTEVTEGEGQSPRGANHPLISEMAPEGPADLEPVSPPRELVMEDVPFRPLATEEVSFRPVIEVITSADELLPSVDTTTLDPATDMTPRSEEWSTETLGSTRVGSASSEDKEGHMIQFSNSDITMPSPDTNLLLLGEGGEEEEEGEREEEEEEGEDRRQREGEVQSNYGTEKLEGDDIPWAITVSGVGERKMKNNSDSNVMMIEEIEDAELDLHTTELVNSKPFTKPTTTTLPPESPPTLAAQEIPKPEFDFSDIPLVDDETLQRVDSALDSIRGKADAELTDEEKVWKLAARGGSSLEQERMDVVLDPDTKSRLQHTLGEAGLLDKVSLKF